MKCQNNIRTLWQGYLAFAAAHENHLPGGFYDASNPDRDKWDWMQGSQVGNYLAGPQQGTLFEYVAHNYDVYRCPSLELAAVAGGGGPGGGSNGRFDYSAFLYVTGCRLDRLPQSATVTDPASGQTAVYPRRDRGGGSPAHERQPSDGSRPLQHRYPCQRTPWRLLLLAPPTAAPMDRRPWINAEANNWASTSIRGKSVNLGTTSITWGWYETQ